MDKLSMLEAYRDTREKIAALRADPCIVSDLVRGSGDALPYSLHSIRVQGVDEKRREANRRAAAALEEQLKPIDDLIDAAPERIRIALERRYRDGLPTWADVASSMGESSVYGLKKAVYRYLDNV